MPQTIITPGQIRITIIYDSKTKQSTFESDVPLEAHLAMSIFIALIQTMNQSVANAIEAAQKAQIQNPFKA